MIDLSHRSSDPEIIDDPASVSSRDMQQTLRELELVNRWLGGQKACLGAARPLVEEIVRNRPGRPVQILDIGSGGADIPAALVVWAKQHGWTIEVLAIDSNWDACRVARDASAHSSAVSVVQGDVFAPPVRPGSVDLVFCSAFLHHFSNEQIAALLGKLRHLARRAIIINDLERHRLAYWGIGLLTRLFSRSAAVRHDGPLSVRKGFRRKDLDEILSRAGITDARIDHQLWGFRWIVTIDS